MKCVECGTETTERKARREGWEASRKESGREVVECPDCQEMVR